MLLSMARRAREISPTGYYHVIQRGVGKQIIFEDEKDYNRYLRKLRESKEQYQVSVVAYCLMSNHVHLLLHSEDIAAISRMMRVLGASYASFYNIKYDHTGHVFQDRYLSNPIKDEEHLLTCIRYIHNNPVRAGIDTREHYKWSSYQDYIFNSEFTDTDNVLSLTGGALGFINMSTTTDEEPIDVNNQGFVLQGEPLRDCQRIINDELGFEFNNGFVLKKLAKEERDRVLRRLRREGYSLKQIELLTGISKRIIQRA